MTSAWREPLIIADASPLIGLAKIGRLQLLHDLAAEIWIPTAVWREVTSTRAGSPEVELLINSVGHCLREPESAIFASFREHLDEGEAAALALASERPDGLLLMDDKDGRRLAARHGFRYLGTLGLLLRGKRAGFVPILKTEIVAIQRSGLYLDEAVIREVLKAAGEEVG